MTATLKPIDAIRHELTRRGYENVTLKTTRREACDILGVDRKSSTKRLCQVLCIGYVAPIDDTRGGKRNKRKLFLINISDTSDFTEFDSQNSLAKTILSGKTFGKPKILDNIISSQYIMLYNSKEYIVSDTLDVELNPQYNHIYKAMHIRQVMKQKGYDVTYLSNMKDIRVMLKLTCTSTIADIYCKLKISYVKTQKLQVRPKRKVTLKDVYNPSHIVEFESGYEAQKKLKMFNYQIHKYYNNSELTVHYEGCEFYVSNE